MGFGFIFLMLHKCTKVISYFHAKDTEEGLEESSESSMFHQILIIIVGETPHEDRGGSDVPPPRFVAFLLPCICTFSR